MSAINNFVKDITNTGKDVGKDLTNAGGDVLKDIKNSINDLGKKIDSVEKTTIKIADKITNIAEDILNFIFNYFKDKLALFIVFVGVILFLPHILGLINLGINLSILAKLKAIES